MADTTDILGLRIPSADGSDPADLAAIIGDLGADVDEAVGNPSLTTTEINALTGDAKAAGRRVWDSTLGVEKVSNGTDWEIQAKGTIIADVVTGTTNAWGELFIAVADSPTGNARWVVTCNHEITSGTQRFVSPLVSYNAGTTYVTFKVANAAGPLTSTPVTIHWQAVAY